MGQFTHLSPNQRGWLREMVTVATKTGSDAIDVSDYLQETRVGMYAHGPLGEYELEAPRNYNELWGLEALGYIAIAETSSFKFVLQGSAHAFYRWQAKRPLGRWLADLAWDIIHENTLWSRIIWMLLAAGLAILVDAMTT